MMKLLSCRFNMDTNRVEARFEDGTTLAIDCIAIEDGKGFTATFEEFKVTPLADQRRLEWAKKQAGK